MLILSQLYSLSSYFDFGSIWRCLEQTRLIFQFWKVLTHLHNLRKTLSSKLRLRWFKILWKVKKNIYNSYIWCVSLKLIVLGSKLGLKLISIIEKKLGVVTPKGGATTSTVGEKAALRHYLQAPQCPWWSYSRQKCCLQAPT